MKIAFISSRLAFCHRRYNRLDEEGVGFVVRWAIIVIVIITRGPISPSRALGFFVDNRVSIMSHCWFSALSSPSPSYLTTVLFCITIIVPLSIGQFFGTTSHLLCINTVRSIRERTGTSRSRYMFYLHGSVRRRVLEWY